MFKVGQHKRLAMGQYKGPKAQGQAIQGDNWSPKKRKGKKRKSSKPLNFKPGGLHKSTGTPKGQKIPKSKIRAAMAGRFGKKAVKQANMAKNVFGVSMKKKAKGKRKGMKNC